MMVLLLDPNLHAQLIVEQKQTLEDINQFRALLQYPPFIIKYIQTYKKHLNVLTRLQKKSRLPFSIPKSHDGDHVTQEKFNPTDQPQGKLQMPLVDAEADMQAERLPPIGQPAEAILLHQAQLKKELTNLIEQDNPQSTAVSDWDLQGAGICGETSVVVYSSRAQQFEWDGFGLKLLVHEGSLPTDVEQCTINIKASLTGEYEFPENCYLISAVFWLCCETVHKFIKPITVEIQHCAKSKNISELNFVRAVCSQKQLPYSFKPKIGGNFERESRGIIDVNSFSAVAVTQTDSEERDYCSTLFYCARGQIMIDLFYVIVWNTEAHLNFVHNYYKEKGALPRFDQAVEFEEDKIRLDLPMDGVTTKEGWDITPLFSPVIMKKNVDSYELGKRIPKCQLTAKISVPKDQVIPDLIHRVKLVGAREPQIEFVIHLSGRSELSLCAPDLSPSVNDESADNRHKERGTEAIILSCSESLLTSAPEIATEVAETATTSSTPPSGPSSSIVVSELITRLDPDTVSLSHLNLIKWKDANGETRRFHIIEEISYKWRKIGGIVGLSHSVMESIVEKNRGNPEDCCRAVLYQWLSNPPPDYPATWLGLIELFVDSKLCKVASTLKELVKRAQLI